MNDFFVCFTNNAILKITVDGAVGGKGEDWLWAGLCFPEADWVLTTWLPLLPNCNLTL